MKRVFSALFVLISILLNYRYCSSQTYSNYEWESPGTYENIPDTFLNHDAVLIRESRTVSFYNSKKGNDIGFETTIKRKVKILTAEGVRDQAVFYLYADKLTIVDARTIKKDGTIIDLNSSHISKQKKSEFANLKLKEKFWLYAIPGVEVGDEIEFIYKGKELGFDYREAIFLNSFLFCLNADLKIVLPAALKCEVLPFNGLAEPIIEQKNDSVSYSFHLSNLTPLYYERYSIPTAELPYLRLFLKSLTVTNDQNKQAETYYFDEGNWDNYLEKFVLRTDGRLYHGRAHANAFSKFLADNIEGPSAAGKSNLDKILFVHNFIRDSITVQKLSADESNNPVGYHFHNRKFDNPNLIYAYSQLFERLNVNFYIGFTRSKYTGSNDPFYLTPKLVTDIFFAYEEQGRIYFFFLKDRLNDYAIGEVPFQFQGCKAVLISKKDIKDRMKVIQLPNSTSEENFKREISKITFVPDSSKLHYLSKINLGGSYSLENRRGLRALKKGLKDGKLVVDSLSAGGGTIDSISVSGPEFLPPYNLKLVIQGEKEYTFQKLADKVYTINLEIILPINNVEEVEQRFMDFYLPFPFTYNIKKFITSEKPIQLTGVTQGEKEIKTEFGVSRYNVSQVNDHTILIENYIQIYDQKIKKEHFARYLEMLKLFGELKKSNLTFKVL